MLAMDQRESIRSLNARLVVAIKRPKVVSEQEQVWHIKIGLSSHARKTIVASRPLQKKRVYFILADRGRKRSHQVLVAQGSIASAAGCANSASVQRLTHQHVQVGGVLNGITRAKVVAFCQLVIDFNEAIVHVGCLQ